VKGRKDKREIEWMRKRERNRERGNGVNGYWFGLKE
jgi:hypothetical protein